MTPTPSKPVLIWDLPLRVWHWLFGISLLTALATALVDGWQNVIVHQWAGISAFCLLIFRITWGLWGARYARWRFYVTTPRDFFLHFLRKGRSLPHSSPGIVLVLILMLAAFIQATTGLFMTDDIFFDGPLHGWVSDDMEEVVDDIHRNAWRLILLAIGVHLGAQIVYAVVLGDKTPMSMITGRKRISAEPTSYTLAALCMSSILAIACFIPLALLAD